MVVKKYILILKLLALGSDTIAKELWSLTVIGMTCQILDPTIVANFTCRSKNFNHTTNIKSYETIYQPGVILNDYHIKVQVYRKFATSYRPFLVTLDQDWYALLNDENSVLFHVFNIKYRRKFGNAYDPCPITGRRYQEAYVTEYETFPDILPDGEYRLEAIAYSVIRGRKRNLFRVVTMGVISPKTAEQWRK